MADLGSEIRNTIKGLKAIRDKQNPPSQDVLDTIDTLSKQLIDIIDASINTATPAYEAATEALQKAAAAARKSLEDLARFEETIAKVAQAIDKVSGLLHP